MGSAAKVADRSDSLLAGEVRRFGPDGVLYEVEEVVGQGEARIRVLDTGEILVYPLASIQADPQS